MSGRFVETASYMNCLENQRIMPSITLAKVEPDDWYVYVLANRIKGHGLINY